MSQYFRLKEISETKNNFLTETKQNELMNEKHKNFSTTLNYVELKKIQKKF